MSQSHGSIRIGFIGAGSIARTRHLPELSRLPQVKVVAVANRTLESGRSVGKEFNIPNVHEDWHEVIDRDDVDAIFIGTWPYMHREMSIAALEAGKHVFCQARMAMDLAEGQEMVAAAKAHPNLVNMVCPPPTRMPFEPFIRYVLRSGQLGPLTAVQLTSISNANLDPTRVIWRERVELSGKQILAVGIHAETLHAILGPYQHLLAQTDTPLPIKLDEKGQEMRIGVPQSVTITGKLVNGPLIMEQHLGLAADSTTRGDQLTIWGMGGTLRYNFGDKIEMGLINHPLKPVDVPADLRRPWQAEKDFVHAVELARQGQPWKVSPDFEEALLYMRKVEAVHKSAATGTVVEPAKL